MRRLGSLPICMGMSINALSQKLPANKNPQYLPNPHETWEKHSPHEVIIFPKFHKNWAKIVHFLLGQSDFEIAFLIKLQL